MNGDMNGHTKLYIKVLLNWEWDLHNFPSHMYPMSSSFIPTYILTNINPIWSDANSKRG